MMNRGTSTGSTGVRAAVMMFAVTALVTVSACQPVRSPRESGVNPTGSLDLVDGGKGEVRVAGWATQYPPEGDSARQRPTPIVVMVDGRWVDGATAATDGRPDVDAYLVGDGLLQWRQPGMGYGFDITAAAPAGEVSVCVVAVNPFMDFWGPVAWTGPTDHVLLGCRTVTVT